ncbi:histone-lysine N-methyltransferase PRDM9-like [Dromiciops gliroides]|uniref:histone-lysine N-methyltransferase PRDM9-like n=1 Tax=Dromiciops gliroides TaxID=33562 RepID=UPI001CC42330|nr:histone-lysine N-methyltransferase PRDM9-like [Dromiciops gliroides]
MWESRWWSERIGWLGLGGKTVARYPPEVCGRRLIEALSSKRLSALPSADWPALASPCEDCCLREVAAGATAFEEKSRLGAAGPWLSPESASLGAGAPARTGPGLSLSSGACPHRMSGDSSSDGSPEEEEGEKGRSPCQGEDTFKDISMYFSKKQWEELREWEKVRFKNVKENYEAMIKIGLTAPRPTFMCRGRPNRRAKVEESGDSDEEWIPKKLVQDFGMNKEMAKEPADPKVEEMMDLSEELKIVVMNNLTTSEAVKKQIDQTDGIYTTNQLTEGKLECRRKEVEVHIYNLRERKYQAYQEIWDPRDDDFLFCEECQTFFLETCAVHGPPKFVQDSAMVKGHPYCSAITLPPGLRIGLSGIPGAGLGVWNEASDLPVGLHFGPYEGQITEDDEAANSGYSWMITKGRNCYEYVDGKEESCSNWMRYVNCARDEEEQNLVAFQYHRQIFYRICRIIRPGCELLVWYGDEYGQELGIKWGSKWKRQLTALTGEQLGPGIHLCPSCPLGFSTHAFLSQHMLLKHPPQVFLDSGTENNYGLEDLHLDKLLSPGYSCVSDKAETSQKEHPSSLWGKTKQVDLVKILSLPQSQQVREKESSSGEWDLSRIQGESTKQTTLALQEEDKKGFGPYKYGEWKQGFTSKSHLITHRWTHSGEKPYVCEECRRGFTHKSTLITHRRTHSGEKPYVCEECRRGFTHKSTLITHRRTHSGEKPYVCEECRRGFTHKSTLITHRRTHSGEKPYVCEECRRGFTQKSHLITHRRTHSGEKPYVCEECRRGFTHKSYLITHRRTHSGEKPYVCEECRRGFTQKSHLITHRRTHSGEKPYVCEECRRGFTHKSHLITHRRTHSGEKHYIS